MSWISLPYHRQQDLWSEGVLLKGDAAHLLLWKNSPCLLMPRLFSHTIILL